MIYNLILILSLQGGFSLVVEKEGLSYLECYEYRSVVLEHFTSPESEYAGKVAEVDHICYPAEGDYVNRVEL